MSLKLRELIKKVRTCKTAEEERSVINKESAEIRNQGKELSDQLKSRNLAKCIFMHMLGYPTSFIHMTCVNLLASSKFTDKRIAYVALCVIMDEKSEVLLLTSHTIKKDLESNNQYIVATALNAIGEVATADMCRDVSPEVIKLLSNNNPYIKKKACLALTKILRKCPELIDTVADKLNLVFEDKNHGVLLCGLALACYIFKHEPVYIDKYRKYLSNMIRYLKNLSSTNYAPEYDINGVTDPFLQVKLLEVLYYFGKGNADASEEMNDLLASISTNTEANKNTGNAVLYELVRTIIGIESNSGLKSIGSSILGKFLSHKDNNYKYIALNTLQEVAKSDLNSVQKHKNIILECLKDSDISIKRRALDLVYLIINTSNIKPIIKECLNFLLVAENEFKLELTTKLGQSLEKYSPSLKWQVDTLIKMLCLAGNFVNDETVSSVINLIVSTPELALYAVHKVFIAMKSNLAQEGLVKVGVYLIGELGDILISNSVAGPDNENISVGEEDVMNLIDEINERKYTPSTKEYLLNCYFKLLIKFRDQKSINHIKTLIENESTSYHCEVQQRASDYLVFSQLADDNLRRDIVKAVPPAKVQKESDVKKEVVIDESDVEDESGIKFTMNGTPTTNKERQQFTSHTNGSNLDSKKTKSLMDDFSDIFGGGNTGNKGVNVNVAKSNTDTMNLFTGIDLTGGSINTNWNDNQNVGKQNNATDLLSSLGALYSNNPVNTNTTNPTNSFPMVDFSNFNPLASGGSANTSSPFPNMTTQTTSNNNFNFFGGSSEPSMNQIFKNNEIAVYSALVKSFDRVSVNGSFYISNNVDKMLTNVKMNLSVKKNVNCKVIATSGTQLEPNRSLGVKKEVTLTNNEPDKNIVMKITLSYTVDGRDVTDSFMFEQV